MSWSCSQAPSHGRADALWADCTDICVIRIGFDAWLLCCRYVCCFSTGESNVPPFPVLGPFFFTRLLSQPRFISSVRQSTSACCDPQFWEELWFYHPSHPGVCGRQWHLHGAPYCLGKTTSLSSSFISTPTHPGKWISWEADLWVVFPLSWHWRPVHALSLYGEWALNLTKN